MPRKVLPVQGVFDTDLGRPTCRPACDSHPLPVHPMTVPVAAMQAVDAALALLPPQMDTPAARVMLLAIGLQESRLTARAQIVNGGGQGPARGLWQFERDGGCAGVLRHSASRYWMHSVCTARGVKPAPADLWATLATDDVLAAAAARLLLFTDPRRLPELGDEASAWALYLRVWRPGKPHPHTWRALYVQALAAVQGAEA